MEVLVLEPWTSSLLCGGYSSLLRNDVCVCFVELEHWTMSHGVVGALGV